MNTGDTGEKYTDIPTKWYDYDNYGNYDTQSISYITGWDALKLWTSTSSTVFVIIEFNSDRSKFKVIGVYVNSQLISDEYKNFTKYQILPVTRYHYQTCKYQITFTGNTNQMTLSTNKESDWIDIASFINNDDFDITLIYNTETNLFECQYDQNMDIPIKYNDKLYRKITTSFIDSHYLNFNDEYTQDATTDTLSY